MSLAKASLWTAASTLVKIGAGLLVVKLLAVSFGPAGVGQAGNFRQLVTVLGVLAGAGIFNGVTKLVAQHHDDPPRLKQVVGTSSAMVLGFSTLLALVFFFTGGGADKPGAVRPYALSGAGTPGGAGADGDRLGELPAGADERLSRCGG
ncbi:O-antigen/teichoic acid export membrane protein [Klebsiella sp. SORGH_AS 1173]|nr:O-antigen/teichoic acid export membrane protein [Klebsiella sp. SORGH_AS_1173]